MSSSTDITSAPRPQPPPKSLSLLTFSTNTANLSLQHPLDALHFRVPCMLNILSNNARESMETEPFDIICLQNTSRNVMHQHIMPQMQPTHDYFRMENGSKSGEAPENFILWRKDRFQKVSSGSFWLSDEPQKVASKSWDSTMPRNVVYCRFKSITETNHSSMSDVATATTDEAPAQDLDEPQTTDNELSIASSHDEHSSHSISSSRHTKIPSLENASLSDFYVFSTHLDVSDQARRYSMCLIREYIDQFLFEMEELEMERLAEVPVFLMGSFNALRDSATMNILLKGQTGVGSSGCKEVDPDSDSTDDDESEDNITLFDLRPQEHYDTCHTYTGFETTEHHSQWPPVSKEHACAIFPQSFSAPRCGECSSDYIISSVPFKVRNFQVHEQRVERTNRFPSDHRPVSCEVILE